MAKYNGIISAFKGGAKLLKKIGWTTGAEIKLKTVINSNFIQQQQGHPLYYAKNNQIEAMCAIGAMKRALYLEYKNEYKKKHGSLKGWDDVEMIHKVEDICNNAESEFSWFLSKKKHRTKLGISESFWEIHRQDEDGIIELFNDSHKSGPSEAKKVMKTMLAAAEARYERLKKRNERRKQR